MQVDTLNADDLGDWLGVSARTVRDLAKRGIVTKAGRSQYALKASVTAYTAHLRATAGGRGGEAAVLDLTEQRARHSKEQADALALKNAATRGETLNAADAEVEWADACRRLRSGVLACTSRIRMQIPALDATQGEVIDRELRAALEALSNDQDYPPPSAKGAEAAGTAAPLGMD